MGNDSTKKIAKAMSELTFMNDEIDNIKKSPRREEENKIKENNAYMWELQNNYKLIKQLEKYLEESINAQSLVEETQKMSIDINFSIYYLWPSIEIIFE